MTQDAKQTQDSLQLVQSALSGNGKALNQLVMNFEPVIRARVSRALRRRAAASLGRDLRQDVEDLSQEVFCAILAQDGRLLRAWDPERGMSLLNWVGLLAERQVANIMRSGRRSPWRDEPTACETFSQIESQNTCPTQRICQTQTYETVVALLQEQLSTKGFRMFKLLANQKHSITEICDIAGMKRDAVYAWRSRIHRTIKGISHNLQAQAA